MPDPPIMPSTAFTTRTLSQIFLPPRQRAVPGELGGGLVVNVRPLLVHKGMVGVVAIEFVSPARRAQTFLELVDRLRREKLILVGEMSLQRHFNIRGLG